jgi:hypothetical protein
MKNKTILLILPLIFLSASCNPFQKAVYSGMIKTVNGGVDWEFKNSIKNSKNASLQRVNVAKLAFDPKNREVIFAGTYNSGFYKSEDSAGSWVKILSKISVYDFVINPYDSKVIYAAGYYGDYGEVLRTVDGGGTWVEIYRQPPHEGEVDPVRAIALNPQDSDQILIGTSAGNFVSCPDARQSGKPNCKPIKDFNDRFQRIFWQNGQIFVLLKTKGLFKSPSLSEDFNSFTESLSRTLSSDNYTYNPNAVKSFNQMFVDPLSNNLIYLSTDRGVYKSVDEGKNWQNMALPIKAEESDARAISIARSSSNIVFTSVGATIYKSVDGGNSWQTQSVTTSGFVNYILIDPQMAQIAYGGIYVSQ